MKILMVGGGGFVGAWCVQRFASENFSIRIFEVGPPNAFFSGLNSGIDLEWVTGDVADTQAVAAAAEGCDAILHMAGVLTPFCSRDPIRGAMINVIGTLNAFEAARAHSINRVVYMSSGGVYSPGDDHELPYPITHYGTYKLANEGSARAYWYDHGITSLGLRPFVVYGPGRETGLTAGPTLACKAAASGQSYDIPYSGRCGMLHVDDVVEACFRGLTAGFDGAHAVNQTGVEVEVAEIVSLINELSGSDRITFSGPEMPSASTAKGFTGEDCIGRLPVTSMKDGLERTLDFYRANPGI